MTDEQLAVLGAACGVAKMPSDLEQWMARYVMRLIERGWDAESAWALCRAGQSDIDLCSDPADTADDLVHYIDVDAGGPP